MADTASPVVSIVKSIMLQTYIVYLLRCGNSAVIETLKNVKWRQQTDDMSMSNGSLIE